MKVSVKRSIDPHNVEIGLKTGCLVKCTSGVERGNCPASSRPQPWAGGLIIATSAVVTPGSARRGSTKNMTAT